MTSQCSEDKIQDANRRFRQAIVNARKIDFGPDEARILLRACPIIQSPINTESQRWRAIEGQYIHRALASFKYITTADGGFSTNFDDELINKLIRKSVSDYDSFRTLVWIFERGIFYNIADNAPDELKRWASDVLVGKISPPKKPKTSRALASRNRYVWECARLLQALGLEPQREPHNAPEAGCDIVAEVFNELGHSFSNQKPFNYGRVEEIWKARPKPFHCIWELPWGKLPSDNPHS